MAALVKLNLLPQVIRLRSEETSRDCSFSRSSGVIQRTLSQQGDN